jgi:hypothetical protein
MRHGRRIEVEIHEPVVTPKKRRKPFKAQWVKLPRQWAEALRRSKRVGTYQLALAILFEAFKRKRYGGEIVLSSAVTRMPRNTKMRAAKELTELGLIKTEQKGNESIRVFKIYYY